jgi:hypothetical protein
MRSQVRASYVARAGNGSTPASRRFSEEVPPVKLWAEAVAVLAAGLSAIVRNPDQASARRAAKARWSKLTERVE